MAEDDSGPVSTWLAKLARARVPEEDLVGLVPGDVVGGERYRICRELGRGGMGIVYEAEDTKLNRRVALKTHQIGSSSARAQLLVEAQAMAKLSHPNVVAVHDVGEFDDGVFLVAELVTGGSLKTWRVPEHAWQAVVRAYVEAGRGLAYAHESGLVHRDFKPGNVLLTRDGRCQVADFGIAISEATPPHTDDPEATDHDPNDPSQHPAGTPAYMAPEVMMGVPADARSDQFSFCVALYEALLGERPFRETSRELLEGTRREAPSHGHTPLRVVRLLERGFSVLPSDRHPSMSALLDLLERGLAPRRTAWLALGTAGLLGTAGYAAARAHEPPCHVDPSPLRAWSDEGRASLAAVFATDVEAELQWPAMERVVDGFVERWVDTATRLCEDSSTTSFELEAHRCLDELRRDGDATLVSLARASGAAARAGVYRASAWTDPSMCLRPDFVLTSRSPSLLLRPRHIALQQRLREISNDVENGGDLDGLARQLDALRPELDALDDPALRARVAIVESGLAFQMDFSAVEPLLKLAYREARAANHSHAATYAANKLTQHLALNVGNVKAALEWAEIAKGEARRDGVPDEIVVEAELYSAIAYDVAGKWNEAADGYDRALAAADAMEGETRERLRSAILTSVSGFEVARGNLERAIATGTEARDICERLDGGPSRSSFAAMSNVGLALANMGEPEQAQAVFERELKLETEWVGPDHPEHIATLMNLGMIASHQHRAEEARRRWLQADALVVRFVGERVPDRGDIALDLGRLDLAAGRNNEAERRFLWAEGVFEETVGPTGEQTFFARVALAEARLALGHHEQACDPLGAMERNVRESLGENRVLARLLGVRGHCASTAGDLARAESFYRSSLELSEQTADAPGERLDIESELAKVLVGKGSTLEALALAQKVAMDPSASPQARARAEVLLAADPPQVKTP